MGDVLANALAGMPYGYTADTAPSRLRPVYRALEPNPDSDYGTLLPFAKNREGSASWVQNGPDARFAMPSMVREGLGGLVDLMAGTETGQVTGRGAQSLVFGGLGAGGMMAPRGAVGAGGVLPRIGQEGRVAGPYITEEPFRSLRDRYGNLLYEASGGKDPNRIKLTDDRIAKAKELLEERHENRTAYMGASAPTETTQQMRDAVAFAQEAVRNGYDTRLKVPDGPYGSLYVRAGDNMVRFADHRQPTEGGQVVGGYSKTLGRRHYPADASVSPTESTLDEVRALIRKYMFGTPVPVAAPAPEPSDLAHALAAYRQEQAGRVY